MIFGNLIPFEFLIVNNLTYNIQDSTQGDTDIQ